jgi:hypothetical protein
MRMFVPVVGAALALALTPQLASAAPIVGGGAFKAAADAIGSAENVTYYGYYGRGYGYRGYGYGGYYRPRYYGYYNSYRPYGYYGYGGGYGGGYGYYRRGYY